MLLLQKLAACLQLRAMCLIVELALIATVSMCAIRTQSKHSIITNLSLRCFRWLFIHLSQFSLRSARNNSKSTAMNYTMYTVNSPDTPWALFIVILVYWLLVLLSSLVLHTDHTFLHTASAQYTHNIHILSVLFKIWSIFPTAIYFSIILHTRSCQKHIQFCLFSQSKLIFESMGRLELSWLAKL